MIHVKHNEFTEPSLLKNSGFYLFTCRTFCPFPLSCITPTSFGTRPLRGSKASESKIQPISEQIEDDCVSEQNNKKEMLTCPNNFSFLQDDYTPQKHKCKYQISGNLKNQIMVITFNFSMLFILVYIPLQIGFDFGHYNLEVLYSIIVLIKLIQFFNDQLEWVNMKELLKQYTNQQLPFHIVINQFIKIIILALLMISYNQLPIVQWTSYFFFFLYITPILDAVLYQIQKQIVCRLPEQQICSQYFSLIIKGTLVLHILNCFLFQSLHQYSMETTYFGTLTNITVNVITLNTNIEPSIKCTQIALLLYYFFMILIILESTSQFNQLSRDLQIYLQKNNLPLQIKLKVYDELINKSHQTTHIHEQLSKDLQEQIIYNQKIDFIQENFSSYDEATKLKLTQLCKTQFFQAGQYIMKLKQKDDNSLYYLMQGKASIQLPKQVKFSLKFKSTFGQLSFFTQCLRTATIVCDSDCTIYKLERSQFLDCLTNQDKQLFQLTKDQIEFNKSLPIKCLCCQQSTHVVANCPDVCYVPEYCLQISKYKTQQRTFYDRKQLKSAKSILTLRHLPKQKNKLQSSSNYSPSNQVFNKDDGSLLKCMDNLWRDSQKVLSEIVLSDKYGTIQGQRISSNKIGSQLDSLKAIPQVIQEFSQDSMSIKNLEDFVGTQPIFRQVKDKKQPEAQFTQSALQRFKKMSTFSKNRSHSSDSSLKLSPIFEKEITNPSNQLFPRQEDHQNSHPFKSESIYKSALSSFQNLNGNQNQMFTNNIVKDDIDKMEIFQLYYPNDNYDQIIQGLIKQL